MVALPEIEDVLQEIAGKSPFRIVTAELAELVADVTAEPIEAALAVIAAVTVEPPAMAVAIV